MEQYATSTVVKDSNLFELQVDHEVSSHLSQTAKWAKFLSIVGFVFIGFMVVMVLFMGTMASSISPFGGSAMVAAGGAGSVMQVVLLLAMVVLYFFPTLFLFNFSNKMLRALRTNDQVTLVASFRQLKLCFKYIGILTLVFISIYLLVIVGALVMAAVR
jgi:hypothetical protein